MNGIMQEHYQILQMYQPLRQQLMRHLTDDDLGFHPGGSNPTLGELCREIGEVEQAYIESFKTFTMDFSYRNNDPDLIVSTAKLTSWYVDLDKDLAATLESLSDNDMQNRVVDRGGDFKLPPHIHLEVYREALHIFHGKVSVYLKAMNKVVSQQWQDWIG